MTNAKTYIVQLWSSSAEPVGFRASVRAVEEADPLFFVTPQELVLFLSQQLEPGGDAAIGGSSAHRMPR
jgi:hypothetical protein